MCEQRLQDLIYWVAKTKPGQTVTEDFVFQNATLFKISKGSAATQRIIDWCHQEIERRNNA